MNNVTLKDGSYTEDVKLDRIIEFDDKSRDFTVMKLGVMETPAPLKTKVWALDRRSFVNQGEEGACVSAGFGHDSAALPLSTTQLNMAWLREKVYFEAQREDPWPGGAYTGASPQYEGTSVLSGAKVMQRLGFFESYYWAFDVDQALQALLTKGTLVVGVWWKEGMFRPRSSGMVDVQGRNLGGHCVCVRGLHVPGREGYVNINGEKVYEPVVAIPQSWGLTHGYRGEIYIKLSEFEALLKEDGECVVPVGRKRVDIRKLV